MWKKDVGNFDNNRQYLGRCLARGFQRSSTASCGRQSFWVPVAPSTVLLQLSPRILVVDDPLEKRVSEGGGAEFGLGYLSRGLPTVSFRPTLTGSIDAKASPCSREREFTDYGVNCGFQRSIRRTSTSGVCPSATSLLEAHWKVGSHKTSHWLGHVVGRQRCLATNIITTLVVSLV